jgi:hypothetical protein
LTAIGASLRSSVKPLTRLLRCAPPLRVTAAPPQPGPTAKGSGGGVVAIERTGCHDIVTPAVQPSRDPPAVIEILQTAGFSDVAFTYVREPVYYGPDVDTALDWVRGGF